MKTSTRDSVIYYWSTRRFLEFFFFFCLYAFLFGCFISGKLHAEIYKDPPYSIYVQQIPEKNMNVCKDIRFFMGNTVLVNEFHNIYLKTLE